MLLKLELQGACRQKCDRPCEVGLTRKLDCLQVSMFIRGRNYNGLIWCQRLIVAEAMNYNSNSMGAFAILQFVTGIQALRCRPMCGLFKGKDLQCLRALADVHVHLNTWPQWFELPAKVKLFQVLHKIVIRCSKCLQVQGNHTATQHSGRHID